MWATPQRKELRVSTYSRVAQHWLLGVIANQEKWTFGTTTLKIEMWPQTHVELLTLKIHFPISNIDARKKLNIWAHVEFQGTSVEFQGASVCWPKRIDSLSIFDNENSIPCNIPVIPALVRCVQLIAVLKIESWGFFEIQDLRVFDLDIDTWHTLITRKFNSVVTSWGKPSYPTQMHSRISHAVRTR